jgi:hypothetical protein
MQQSNVYGDDDEGEVARHGHAGRGRRDALFLLPHSATALGTGGNQGSAVGGAGSDTIVGSASFAGKAD